MFMSRKENNFTPVEIFQIINITDDICEDMDFTKRLTTICRRICVH